MIIFFLRYLGAFQMVLLFILIDEYVDVFIWELPDEYFLVIISPITSPVYKDSEFYKCDQWEGIEELFKKERILE